MKYLFDNCISPKFAPMLRALEEDVTALREEFSEDVKDVPLFEMLKDRRLVFISTDTSQLTREHEARALQKSGNTALYLGPFFEKMTLWDQAIWIIRRWQKIKGFAEGVVPGTVAEIKQNGKALIYRF